MDVSSGGECEPEAETYRAQSWQGGDHLHHRLGGRQGADQGFRERQQAPGRRQGTVGTGQSTLLKATPPPSAMLDRSSLSSMLNRKLLSW